MRPNSRFVTATVCAFGIAVAALWATSSRAADTTADCGRFFLKTNKTTGEKECVNKFRGKKKAKEGIRARVREVDRALAEVDRILGQESVTTTDRDRIQKLLELSRAKIEEIRQRSRQLSQQQQAFRRQLLSQELQRVRAQEQQAQQFFRSQQSRSQRLLGEQRSRLRSNAASQ